VHAHEKLTAFVELERAVCIHLLTEGRTIWIVDAHRGDGKQFVVQADEKLTAFLELESAIRGGQRLAPAIG